MPPCLVRPHLLHGCKLILGPLTHDLPVYTYTCVLKHTPVFFWTYVYCPNGPTFWDRNGRNDSTATLDGLTLRLNQIYWCLGHTENPQISRDTRDIPPKDEERRCSVFHSQARASWLLVLSSKTRTEGGLIFTVDFSFIFCSLWFHKTPGKQPTQAVQKIIKDL